ncbi:hypothetical protein [Secundilactobacillus kimchicus]|uniref:hypothetical protein n=1 Tax=Secundilactobacillus kimchicus TaxID=528209 RepID=UPI0024A7CA5A|nr:hypothetical protein [Secundilactobacillus kimchicus]
MDEYMRLQQAASDSQQTLYQLISDAVHDGMAQVLNEAFGKGKQNGGSPSSDGGE